MREFKEATVNGNDGINIGDIIMQMNPVQLINMQVNIQYSWIKPANEYRKYQ